MAGEHFSVMKSPRQKFKIFLKVVVYILCCSWSAWEWWRAASPACPGAQTKRLLSLQLA